MAAAADRRADKADALSAASGRWAGQVLRRPFPASDHVSAHQRRITPSCREAAQGLQSARQKVR